MLMVALGLALLAAFGLGRVLGTQAPALGPSWAHADDGGTALARDVEVPAVLHVGGADPSIPTGLSASRDTASENWHPAERYEDKDVPIISLLDGTKLGVARVNGPRSRVIITQAVAQFSIGFMNFFDIDIYIPISAREPGRRLSRVPGVGVTGLGDTKL